MKSMKIWLSISIALVGSSLFADWSWSGKTGSITIPSGTTATVADGDVSTVEALTAIEIEDGATLSFVNTANRCTLSADLSGNGSLTTGDGTPVTFAGDNRSFTGGMRFTNSKIIVTSRYGLGSATDAGGETRYVYSDGSYHASARPNADGLKFQGAGLTNDVGICWYGNRADSARVWFVDSMSDPLVLNGPIKMNKQGNVDFVRVGNWIFNGGIGEVAGTPGYQIASGCKAYIREKPVVQATSLTSYRPYSIEANAELHLCVGGGTWNNGNIMYGSGKVVCDAANVLPTPIYGLGSKSSKNATIDLNGFDQTVGQLTNPTRTDWYGYLAWNPEPGESGYVCITSAVPATLTMTSDTSTTNFAGRFSGYASLSKTGSAPLFTFVNQYSDTKGTLSVSSGAVRFIWGAGWGGDVALSGTGKVIFEGGNSLGTDRSVLIEDSGKIVVSNGLALVCRKLVWQGNAVEPGLYAAGSCDWLEGDGSLYVITDGSDESIWKGGGSGWNDPANWEDGVVPGAGDFVLIPSGSTVVVADADVAQVASLGRILIDSGAALSFENTSTRCVLSADLFGNGSLTTGDGTPVTFAGYNRYFTGAMRFTNSKIVVTSRYGLGSATDAGGATRYVYSDGSYHASARPNADGLKFQGAGLTNDVGICWYGTRSDSQRVWFVDSMSDPLVLNGPIKMNKQGNVDYVRVGNWIFNGGIGEVAGTPGYHIASGCKAYIREEPVVQKSGYRQIQILTGAELHMCVGGGTWSSDNFICGSGTFVCDADNVIPSPICGLGQKDVRRATIDLNGHNQTTGRLKHPTNSNFIWNPAPGSADYVCITSAVPATLTMTSDTSTTNFAGRFSGYASLAKTGVAPLFTFVNQYSDTRGTLSVSKGEVKFLWGAGWGGDIAASGSGKVVFAEPCPANRPSTANGSVTLSDSAKLAVSNGVRYCCASLTLGGTTITAGRVTASSHPGWIEGGGCVQVGKPGMSILIK